MRMCIMDFSSNIDGHKQTYSRKVKKMIFKDNNIYRNRPWNSEYFGLYKRQGRCAQGAFSSCI